MATSPAAVAAAPAAVQAAVARLYLEPHRSGATYVAKGRGPTTGRGLASLCCRRRSIVSNLGGNNGPCSSLQPQPVHPACASPARRVPSLIPLAPGATATQRARAVRAGQWVRSLIRGNFFISPATGPGPAFPRRSDPAAAACGSALPGARRAPSIPPALRRLCVLLRRRRRARRTSKAVKPRL